MNSYHFNGIAFSSGDRVTVIGLNDKHLDGTTGIIVAVHSGGVKVRFGNIAEGHSTAFLHPNVLRKVA